MEGTGINQKCGEVRHGHRILGIDDIQLVIYVAYGTTNLFDSGFASLCILHTEPLNTSIT